ncbi:CDP-alcohol phosphatidyltransferase family protein [Rothia terrae]|uniref:CDP-alcohol phosphatidyltransferase family protein n=1 Tax=Rothia terrae TaxID=396015 RepID=UPI0028815A26|nr:CDP-alcohol phosphatidyltransferase family protein [Rothia terrae]MDT0190146.1 CDP-alcohol phosphatidyltransferase family protein [Rothia terrae]
MSSHNSINSRPKGFRETLSQLNSAQKPGNGVPAYTRWVNRRLARYFAAACVKFGISPNGVTAISSILSLIGILVLLLATPSFLSALTVAVLFALGYAMDSADGQVARVTGTSSPAGEWLDHVVDAIRTPAQHLAVLVGFIRFQDHWPLEGWALWWLPMAFSVLTVGYFMSQILAEQLRNNRKTAAPPAGGTMRSFINLHMDSGTFCWMFILWGWGLGFTVAYGLLFLAFFLTTAMSMRRKYVSLNTPQEA